MPEMPEMPLKCKATQFVWKASSWCNAMQHHGKALHHEKCFALYMRFSALYKRWRKVLAWCDAPQATLHLKLRFSMHLKWRKASPWCNEHHLCGMFNNVSAVKMRVPVTLIRICTLYTTEHFWNFLHWQFLQNQNTCTLRKGVHFSWNPLLVRENLEVANSLRHRNNL